MNYIFLAAINNGLFGRLQQVPRQPDAPAEEFDDAAPDDDEALTTSIPEATS